MSAHIQSVESHYAIRLWEADSFWRMDKIDFDPSTDAGKERVKRALAEIEETEKVVRAEIARAELATQTKAEPWKGFQATLVLVATTVAWEKVEL